MTLEEVSQCQESHRKEVDPDELTNRPVIVDHFGDVKKEAIHFSHGAGIVKWPGRSFNPALQITGKINLK